MISGRFLTRRSHKLARQNQRWPSAGTRICRASKESEELSGQNAGSMSGPLNYTMLFAAEHRPSRFFCSGEILMDRISRTLITTAILSLLVVSSTDPARAKSADEIDAQVNQALDTLYTQSLAAKELGGKAHGILVSQASPKAALSLAASTASELFGSTAKRKDTIAALPVRSGCSSGSLRAPWSSCS